MPAWNKFRFYSVAATPANATGYAPVPPASRQIAGADLKYTCMHQDTSGTQNVAGCYLKQEGFLDWDNLGSGTDAAAFLITGYMTAGDSARHKYAPWLTVHCERTERA